MLAHGPGLGARLLLCFLLALCSLRACIAAPTALSVPAGGEPGFTLVPPSQTHLDFTNHLAMDRQLTNQIYLNGSGVAAGDVDGDGWCDLYFCALDNDNRLFRNLGGWRFEDITDRAGVACPGLNASGAVLADLDGDGDLDLVVNSLGQGTWVFLNNGKGVFVPNSRQPALNARRGGCSMSLGDLDGDGDLDLYIANYRTVTIRDQPNTRFTIRPTDGLPRVTAINDVPIQHPDLVDRFVFTPSLTPTGGKFSYTENGEPDLLLLNDGTGLFTELPFTQGAFLDEEGEPLRKAPVDWGLAVLVRDFNGDRHPDIYVCNDFLSPDRLWLNLGNGTFRAAPRRTFGHTSLSSMGVDAADINRDGFDDILVVDMLSRDHHRRRVQRTDLQPEESPIGAIANTPQNGHNTLFLNRGQGTYAEIAQWAGLDAAEWAWTPAFLDVDLDGYEDVLISNGFARDNMNVDQMKRVAVMKAEQKLSPLEQLRLRAIIPPLATANAAFRNLGNLRFADVSEAWGFAQEGISQGLALADLDNDGDLDVVVNNMNGPAQLSRNNSSAPRVAVRLRGHPPNTQGIGAFLRLSGGAVALQTQQIISGGRYLSSDQAIRVFAAGPGPMRLEVVWRSGRRSVLQSVQLNHLYEVDEASATDLPEEPAAPALALFADVTPLLNHTHHEDPFDDFSQQPSLPKRLSQLGPGMAWGDLDEDGWEDLVIASGRGAQLAAFHNEHGREFKKIQRHPFSVPVTRDQTTVLVWNPPSGPSRVLAGSANYEDGFDQGSLVREYRQDQILDPLPGSSSSTGPMALADIDGDGDLDLFVGGRMIAGTYPAPADSQLFRWTAQGFQVDKQNQPQLSKLGMVSGAVFSDVDDDGDPDLLLACEWGPVRLLRNDGGRFTETTAQWGLHHYQGWWQGINTGDFDNDGRLDIVASNWGRNSRYQRFLDRPLRMYYGDLDGNGAVDCVEAVYDPVRQQIVPLRELDALARALPVLHARFATHEAFSHATVIEALGPEYRGAHALQLNWPDTTLFLNRGDHFEPRALPSEAQFAPAFAVNVTDFNGDGQEDLFLSQNFFALPPEVSRHDAGCGLLLLGDGQGKLLPLTAAQSGIEVYGEQRGAALADYDHDGRVDLAVSQNAASTRLFRNVRGQPGLRIRLKGPAGNPRSIGARLRVRSRGTSGPAREIHAGSGYWSQDSAVQILHVPSFPAELIVRWPGGGETVLPMPSDPKELTVQQP